MTGKVGAYVDGSSPSGALTMRQKMLDVIAAGTTPVPPYVARLCLRVVAMEWRSGFVAVTFHIPDELCVEPDVAFGGHVAAIHDQAAGFALFSVLEDDMVFATTQLNVTYLTMTRPGDVHVEARLDAMDERSAVVRVSLLQGGKVTSESVVTEAIRKARR